MNKFILPLSGDDDGSSSTKYKIKGFDGDRVFSPYNGKILNISSTDDYGSFEIEHDFDGKKIVSKIENVYDPISGFGNLRKGETIGYVKDKSIVFTAVDEKGKKIDIEQLLSGEGLSKEQKKEQKKKAEYKQKSVEYEKLPALARLFGDIAKTPAYLVKKGVQSVKNALSEQTEKESVLIEQSERIKDLIKKINK